MTNKEYRAKLGTMDVYNGYDYLNRNEVKKLRRDANSLR